MPIEVKSPCCPFVDWTAVIKLNHLRQSLRNDHLVLAVGERVRDMRRFGIPVLTVELPCTVLIGRGTRFDDEKSPVSRSNGFCDGGQKTAADTLTLSVAIGHDHDQFPRPVGHFHRHEVSDGNQLPVIFTLQSIISPCLLIWPGCRRKSADGFPIQPGRNHDCRKALEFETGKN